MKHLSLLLFLLTVTVNAQTVSGVVRNAATNRALPFAKISVSGIESLTDADGRFTIKYDIANPELKVSYNGFIPQNIAIVKRYYKIYLSVDTTYKEQDSAHAIIRRTIALRKNNDPRQQLQSFRFKSYNKLIVSANADSIRGNIDTSYVRRFGKTVTKIDSADFKFKKLIQKQHLFQTEVTSEFKFDGTNFKEIVSGIKMSGFKQPVYELLALHLQSFSVYGNTYELFETTYNSPLAENAFSVYNYSVLGSIQLGGRPVQIIYFKSKRKNRKTNLQGLLYIDSETNGIAKAIFRTRGLLDISATHEYEFVREHGIWFPVGKKLRITKGTNDADIRIFGETLRFETDFDAITARKQQASDFTYLLSESRFFDIEYNIPVNILKPAIATEIEDSAPTQEESFWKQYRQGSDLRSANTYIKLDSIVKRQRVEKKLFVGRKLINGYVPLGPFDVDLRYLLSYNNYEGFRLGFGGITNEQFSRKYRIEGYSAYGTKDGNFKYNLGAAARLGRFSNTWIGMAYTDDVREIASTTFAIDKRVFKLYDPRPINVSTFYNHVSWRGYIETKLVPKTESIWQLQYSRIEPKFNYLFIADEDPYRIFHMTTAMVSLQWNPFSDYMQTPVGRIESEKRFPKFTFQFTQAIPDLLENDFEFGKLDVRAEYEKKYINGQKSALVMEAGYAYGDIPLTHLYNTSPNNLTKDRLLQRITFAGKNSFETMYFNEFFSSKYVFLQLKHGLKRIKIVRKVRPSLVFVTRMAWGTMDHREQHIGIDYKTLEDGYFESGLELNQIFKGFGLSGFYRYGPNQLSQFEDNLALKLSFILNLGF